MATHRLGQAAMRGWLMAMAVVMGSCAIVETEPTADQARATIVRYLEALGGAEPDRGWSILSEPMRESYPEEDTYLRIASRASGPPPIDDIALTHENDGFFAFTVSYSGDIHDAYSQVLFTARGARASPIACPNGRNQFEMAVIVGDGRFAGITANSCVDGELTDPRE